MDGIYELESVQGTQVIPVGALYSFVHLERGDRALIHQHNGEGGYTTSPVRQIITLDNKVVIQTKNSVYTFKEAE